MSSRELTIDLDGVDELSLIGARMKEGYMDARDLPVDLPTARFLARPVGRGGEYNLFPLPSNYTLQGDEHIIRRPVDKNGRPTSRPGKVCRLTKDLDPGQGLYFYRSGRGVKSTVISVYAPLGSSKQVLRTEVTQVWQLVWPPYEDDIPGLETELDRDFDGSARGGSKRGGKSEPTRGMFDLEID